MPTALEIKIDSSIFKAKFLDKIAPVTCAAVRKMLPCEADAPHGCFSGWSILLVVPWNLRALPRENETIYGSPGDLALSVKNDTSIAMSKGIQHVYISHEQSQYRALHGSVPCNLFAKVTDNLDEFHAMGRKIWQNGKKRISLREI
jgi:hypothetical protein